MADGILVVSETEQIVLLGDVATEVIDLTQEHELLDTAEQGPPGPPGIKGDKGDDGAADIAADLRAYYILAKA